MSNTSAFVNVRIIACPYMLLLLKKICTKKLRVVEIILDV